MSKQKISYKWVLIGAGIIVIQNFLAKALLADPIKTNLLVTFPGLTGVLIFIGLIAFVSFFVGGALIGLFSPGETLKEPAYAALIAAGLNCLEAFGTAYGTRDFTVLGWLIGSLLSLGIGFVMALGGAWVGEKMQGDTPEKHKEAQEPPPSRAE